MERKSHLPGGGGSDNLDIYIKLINTGEPFRLTSGTEAEIDPAWSPDGSLIAFRRSFPDRGEIVILPALGGAERRIAVLTAGIPLNRADQLLARYAPASFPDERQIAVVDSAGEEPMGIHLVDVESGEKRRLTMPDRRDERDTEASFSPQGDRLAFVRWRAGAYGSSDLYVQSIKAGEPRRLTFDHRQISGLTWTPDGQHITFVSERNGDFRLWQIGLHGGAPTLFTVAERGARHPSLSRDGKRLVFFPAGLLDQNLAHSAGGGKPHARALHIFVPPRRQPYVLSGRKARRVLVKSRRTFRDLGLRCNGRARLAGRFFGRLCSRYARLASQLCRHRVRFPA